MAKTQFLQIRLSPEERALLKRAASREYLDISTWARQALMRAAAMKEEKAMKRPVKRSVGGETI